MAQTIITKNGTGLIANADVVTGELAINTDSGILYYGDTSGNVATVKNSYVLQTYGFYINTWTSGNYYYGNNSHGNMHHQFNGSFSTDPDGITLPAAGVQHNGITVPFDTNNIGLRGVVQGATGGNTLTYKLYKGTRQDGGATPTLTEIGSDTGTVVTSEEWKFQNIDIETTAKVSSGETIWVMVVPSGTTPSVFKSSYTLFGDRRG